MAVLYLDGFERYGNTVNAVTTSDVVGNCWVAVSESAMKVRPARSAGNSSIGMESSTTRIIRGDLGTTNATMVVGVGIHVNTVSGAAFQPIWLRTDDTWGINLQINTNGSVVVRRNTTTLATSANTGVITANTWHWVLMKILCDNSAGTYDVWVDGVLEVTGTGADTREHASKNYHNGIQLRAGNLTQDVWFDDLYILDGTGTKNNDESLGDKVITRIGPNGDDTTDWTANGGGSHYADVDGVPFDGDTNFISTDTATDQDIFDYEALAASANIAAVQVTTDVKESSAKSYGLKTLAKSSGNTVNGGEQFVGSTDWTSKSIVFEEDPDGANWVSSTVNSTAFGVEAT